MAYEVIWTGHAAADVDWIISCIANDLDSPKAAENHLDAFLEAVDDLGQTPEAYGISPTPALARRNLRTYFVKNYVMVFLIDGSRVVIQRVFHMRQDYARFIE